MTDLISFLDGCRKRLPTPAVNLLMRTLLSFKRGEISESESDECLLFILRDDSVLVQEYNLIMDTTRSSSSPPISPLTMQDEQRQHEKRAAGDVQSGEEVIDSFVSMLSMLDDRSFDIPHDV